ncbi:hypothetical protein BDZ97DRAFT_1913862 [Flammula alnicola]|nr:hypothetical protein BDZ97DRAFT_1913862 [Flammula alnicola]
MAPTPPILGPDDLHFWSMETTEDMIRDEPGGYHPIIIGDILSPSPENSESGTRQYRTMHKLGYGSYATVWLVQTTDSSKDFVAVKVTAADGVRTREAAMLEAALRSAAYGLTQAVAQLHAAAIVHGEISPSGADAWWASHREYLRQNCADEADTDALIALLRKVLVLDPTARPTAAEVLQD